MQTRTEKLQYFARNVYTLAALGFWACALLAVGALLGVLGALPGKFSEFGMRFVGALGGKQALGGGGVIVIQVFMLAHLALMLVGLRLTSRLLWDWSRDLYAPRAARRLRLIGVCVLLWCGLLPIEGLILRVAFGARGHLSAAFGVIAMPLLVGTLLLLSGEVLREATARDRPASPAPQPR